MERHPLAPLAFLPVLVMWLNRVVLAITVVVPPTVLTLGLIGGWSTETVFYTTLFGLIVSVMFWRTARPKRHWTAALLQPLLEEAVRRSIEEHTITSARDRTPGE